MKTNFKLIPAILLMVSCSQEPTKQPIVSSLFVGEFAKLTKEGVWRYTEERGIYDNDTICFAKIDGIKETKKLAKTKPPLVSPHWFFYIGKPGKGTAYGYYEYQAKKRPIAYSNKEWLHLEDAEMERVRTTFMNECMQEGTTDHPSWAMKIMEKIKSN